MINNFKEFVNSINEAKKDLGDQYSEYFYNKMKEHGIEDIASLTTAQKKEFFNDVDDNWIRSKGPKHEMANEALSGLQIAYRDYFKALLNEFDVDSPTELNSDEKKKFFDKVKTGWKKGVGPVKESVKSHRYTKTVIVDKDEAQKFEFKVFGAGLKWDDFYRHERFSNNHFSFTDDGMKKIKDFVNEFAIEIFDHDNVK